MPPYHRRLTNPASIAAHRAARARQLILDGRRGLMREVRDAIAPSGVLVVEGVRWLVEVRETEDGFVRADAACGAFRVYTLARWSTVAQVAAELGEDLLEHIGSVHAQIVATARAIDGSHAATIEEAGELLRRAG